eukprot:scaffold9716_cov70-Phaeocystis_antarctica.AAC.6
MSATASSIPEKRSWSSTSPASGAPGASASLGLMQRTKCTCEAVSSFISPSRSSVKTWAIVGVLTVPVSKTPATSSTGWKSCASSAWSVSPNNVSKSRCSSSLLRSRQPAASYTTSPAKCETV